MSVFYGNVHKGVLKLGGGEVVSVGPAGKLHGYLAGMKGSVKLTVAKFERTRSNRQNRWLWGVAYQLLADHTGHDKDEIHEWVKDAIGLRKEIRYKDADGKEHTQFIIRSTTEYSTSEMKTFMEMLQQWAVSELGVVVPDPNEVDPESKDFGPR